MKSICLVNVFFGKFPWYFNFFLKSCGTNPTVDFLIFTDQEKPESSPSNVRFIPFSLEKFNNLASEKLNLEIEIKCAYKLCDFKPAYYVILSEYLQHYDFWGITDIDIIFGRIREFISDEMLSVYEVISVRNDYPTGSFMLFKNQININNLFKRSRDYMKIFTSQKHYCFDECNFEHFFLEEGGNIFDIETEIESMHHILMKEIQNNNLKVHFDFLIIEGLPGKLFWDKGLLSFKNEFEVLHYHLILYKGNQFTVKPKWNKIPDQFFIDKYSIRRKNIFSLFSYLYNNKLKIWINKQFVFIEYLLSKKIKQNPINFTEKSITFTNGKTKKILSKYVDASTYMSFSKNSCLHKVYKSPIRKNLFFLDNRSNIYFMLKNNGQELVEITNDGSTFTLIKE